MSDERPDGTYGWLYGESKPAPPAPRQGSSGLPPPNLPPPGRRIDETPPTGPKKPRTRHNGRRIFGIIVLAWIVFLVAVPVWAWGQIDKVDASPASGRPDDQPGTTYLLVGSDSRRGLTKAEQKELTTGGDGGGRGRTDTIMLLHTGSGPSVLMSLPRDSIVDIPNYGRTKINAAYAFGGPKLLVRTIEGNTGIKVDDYIEVGFGGLVKVVDSLGGVEICPKESIKDKDSGLDVKKGCQEADGATALAYSRSRHAQLRGDLDRVKHQREVVGAIGKKVLSPWSVLNPVRWWRLNHAVPDFFAFGEGTSTLDAGRWALAMSKSGGDDGLTCTMPVTDGSANTWDRSRADPLFEAIIDDDTDKVTAKQCSPTGIAGVK